MGFSPLVIRSRRRSRQPISNRIRCHSCQSMFPLVSRLWLIGEQMPIILPPTTRRQFIKDSLALGSTAMMISCALAGADDQRVKLDQNRVALLADTHIRAGKGGPSPNRLTKVQGAPLFDLCCGRGGLNMLGRSITSWLVVIAGAVVLGIVMSFKKLRGKQVH